MNFLLIGMTFSGKSYIGGQIAKELDMTFIDQDVYVRDYVEKNGLELDFPKGQHKNHENYLKASHELRKLDNTIVSSGARFGLIDNLDNYFSNIIFLNASNDLIINRYIENLTKINLEENNRRSIIKNKKTLNEMQSIIEYRRNIYFKQTNIHFSYNNNKEQNFITNQIIKELSSIT